MNSKYFKKRVILTYDLLLNMLKDFSDEEVVDDKNEVVAPDAV